MWSEYVKSTFKVKSSCKTYHFTSKIIKESVLNSNQMIIWHFLDPLKWHVLFECPLNQDLYKVNLFLDTNWNPHQFVM